jgi:hypothetical protein
MGKQNSQGVLEFTFRIGDWDHCKEEANAIRPRTDASAKIRLFIAPTFVSCFSLFVVSIDDTSSAFIRTLIVDSFTPPIEARRRKLKLYLHITHACASSQTQSKSV